MVAYAALGFESLTHCHGRLSELGSGLFRKQIDPKGLEFDSLVFLQLASADGAVLGLLSQVMGVRISPEAPTYFTKRLT